MHSHLQLYLIREAREQYDSIENKHLLSNDELYNKLITRYRKPDDYYMNKFHNLMPKHNQSLREYACDLKRLLTRTSHAISEALLVTQIKAKLLSVIKDEATIKYLNSMKIVTILMI